jgi:hypothetical protein
MKKEAKPKVEVVFIFSSCPLEKERSQDRKEGGS